MTGGTKKSWGIFGATALLSTLLLGLWSQLTPLGSAPDESSHFVKSAAVIRGELKGEELPGWFLSTDGWAHESSVGISHILIVSNGEVLQRTPPSVVRDDVTTSLNIAADTVVGFSIHQVEFDLREPYSIYAELNDGKIIPLQIFEGDNVLTSPTNGVVINGVTPRALPTTSSLVEESHINGRLEYSYWSTYVAIDPQFAGAGAVQDCFVSQATKPACDLTIEQQQVSGERPITGMGLYTPAIYVVPGLGTLLGASNTAWYVARLTSMFAAALVVALAAVVLLRRRQSLIPLLVVLVPAVLYLASVVNPSGLEITGAIALWIAAPGVLKADRRDSWELACFTVSGVTLILARPLGMVYFLAVLFISIVATGSWRSLVGLIRRHRWSVATHAATLLFAAYWYVAIYDTNVDKRRAAYLGAEVSLMEQVFHAFGDIYRVLLEAVGDLGSLEIPIPRLVFLALLATTVWLISVGWMQSNKLTRVATTGLVILSILLVIATDVNYYRILRGYGVQGRHLTPLLVGIPLLIARTVRLSLGARRTVVTVWILAQLLAGYTALRRYSVGIVGDNFFTMFSDPVWQPPFGIAPTLAVLALLLMATGWGVLRLEPQND